MCLVVIAWRCHPHYPVILASNRDEFYARPATTLAFQAEDKVYAGQDLQKGGYWCGFSTRGLWGVVTNVRQALPNHQNNLSRGHLLRYYLTGEKDKASLKAELAFYPPVNLLLGSANSLSYLTNCGKSQELPAGLYVLSNGYLDEPWFKVRRARAYAEELLAKQNADLIAWLPMMLDETKTPLTEELPQTGFAPEIERLLSSAFIISENYGTRVTTLARRNVTGLWQLQEITHVPKKSVVEFSFQEEKT